MPLPEKSCPHPDVRIGEYVTRKRGFADADKVKNLQIRRLKWIIQVGQCNRDVFLKSRRGREIRVIQSEIMNLSTNPVVGAFEKAEEGHTLRTVCGCQPLERQGN